MLQLLYLTLPSCIECKVYTFFQKQISRTFPELILIFFFQDSKFNPFHSHNLKLNTPDSLQTFLKFRNCLSQADFQDFPGLSRTCSLFPGLSSAGKCQNKIPRLSRFSRTCKNLVNSLITKQSCQNYSAIIGGALLLEIVGFK